MKVGGRSIDHIVYCVNDLNAAISDLESRLGIAPTYGGRHMTQGTHNAILDLSENCYLEILAVDKENKTISHNRWMGIDLVQRPMITRWALKSKDLISDQQYLQSVDSNLGQIVEGSRKTPVGNQLAWRMLLPLAEPVVEILPFMVDWSSSDTHPTQNLPKGCTLKSFALRTPDTSRVHTTLSSILEAEPELEFAEEPQILVTIEGPSGIVTL